MTEPSGIGRLPVSRQSQRVDVSADVTIRRPGERGYKLQIVDLSPHGCRAQFVVRPEIHAKVWVTFGGLEALSATVCWVNDFEVGLEFDRPIYPAVFEMVISRLKK
ncbi:PilZ domain-containing protein [Sphingomonas sp. LY29]|uniref:PilZ domain-containing protein n=1 Tax=Sphingomonas sp. LY29 TaxID=3095341 RepID=UPI003A7F521C